MSKTNEYDVERIRLHFKALESGIAFFDGPGGSQVPTSVGRAIADAITSPMSNRGDISLSEKNAETAVLNYRKAIADLLECDYRGVIYGRSWTQLTYDFSRHLAKTWQKGDEIIVTNLDHDSNIRPWVQAAEAKEVIVKWAKFDPKTGELPPSSILKLLTNKTRLVAVTGAANTLGTRPDIETIGTLVRDANAKTRVYVDGVHLTPHAPISFRDMAVDFYGFSSYKLFGPHCATLVAKPSLLESLHIDKLLPSTMQVPERFEFGTLPYEIMAGVTAAVDFIAEMVPADSSTTPLSRRQRILRSMTEVEKYEQDLFEYLEFVIAKIPGAIFYGKAKNRTPTLYFSIEGADSKKLSTFLGRVKRINVPVSNFYALEVSRALGLGDSGALRVGLAPYNTKEEVDRLAAAIKEFFEKGDAPVEVKEDDVETAERMKEVANELVVAAEMSYLGETKRLVRSNADVDTQVKYMGVEGTTALHRAALHGHTPIVHFLLESKADANLRDQNGNTPLTLAAWQGHDNSCRLLVEHKADIDMKNNKNESALTRAVGNNQTVTAELLAKAGAKIEVE